MSEFNAFYYDGKTSARTPVCVRPTAQSLHIVGPSVNIEVPLAAMQVDARIGNLRRTINLPDGAQLQTDDHAALDALFPHANPLETWVQTLERKWGYALAAVALTAGFVWWCVVFGLPLAASFVAAGMPQSVEAKLGEHTLTAIDHSGCSPSGLTLDRIAAIQKQFDLLIAGLNDGATYRLAFRFCRGIGPNAFALPGGTIIVIDDLVKLAKNDQQIAAVLAHEIGHVRFHHGLRMALQGAGAAALIAALAGDAVTMTKLAVALPTLLMQSGYSRTFETEADSFAFERLKSVGLSPSYFAEMMELLEQDHAARNDKPAGKAADAPPALEYLSTHPATAERIRRARDYR